MFVDRHYCIICIALPVILLTTDKFYYRLIVFINMAKRRNLLASIGTVGSIAIAGCSSGSDDSGGNSPQETIEGYYTEVSDGNIDSAMSHIHPDAVDSASEEEIAEFGSDDYTVEAVDMETLQEEEDEAVVETLVRAESPLGTNTATYELTLRRHNSEWKLYETEEV